jgi:hypothetical protein
LRFDLNCEEKKNLPTARTTTVRCDRDYKQQELQNTDRQFGNQEEEASYV